MLNCVYPGNRLCFSAVAEMQGRKTKISAAAYFDAMQEFFKLQVCAMAVDQEDYFLMFSSHFQSHQKRMCCINRRQLDHTHAEELKKLLRHIWRAFYSAQDTVRLFFSLQVPGSNTANGQADSSVCE